MKKLFLLIPALLLSLAINADVINITTTFPYSDGNNLRRVLADANSGDIIEMEAGTYVETGNWIAVDDKDVIVRAAEGAEVIIKPQFSVRIKAGTTNHVGKVEFIGVKFDCSALESDQLIVPSDNQANQSVVLKNCELYDWSKNDALIKTTSSRRLDAIEIDNCYFHGFEKSILFLENTNPVSLSVTNSTFANVAGAATYYAAPIDVRAASGSVLVDHCTFYNVNSMSLSYGTVTVKTIANPVVSNCIFMLTASVDMCATYLMAGGDVKNCLTYNYDNWQPYGHYNTATKTDCAKANPLFKDAANGEFSLYAASPARGAGLAGSDLGDPRWHKALAPVAIPATLVPFDALLSDKASIIQSTPDSIFLKTESETIKEWAKWNITVAEDGLYDFTAYAKRTGSTGSQRLQIDVLNSTETETLKTKAETDLPNECTISSGAVNLVAGNTYVIKVYNNYEWAKSKLIKVEASYAGGKTIAIPDTLKPVDAIKSERAFVNEAGELRFTDDGHDGYVREQYGKWNISVAKAGNYKFTVSANSNNSHAYELILRNSDETSDIASETKKGSSNTPLKFALDVENLAIGNYVLNIRDTTNYSHGRIEYIAASYEGGAVVNAPGEILAAEAVLLKEDGGTLKMIHGANGDIEYKSNKYNMTEYAQWNLHATEAGEMVITVNSPSEGHTFRFELYEGTTLKSSAEEEAETEWQHNFTLTQHLNIPSAGDYTLKLINKQQYSVGVLHSITIAPYVAPAALEINEAATDNSAWVANVGGAAANVQLIRTFKGGVYNSICVPFEAPMSKIKAAFGDDVELLYLEDANMSGDILNLVFANAPDFYQGTPYLIKPSADVVNPEFENVNLLAAEAASTSHTGWPASFKGTFVKQTIDANENNLYLGTDNKLYFSNNDVTIKGLRAYFNVNIPNPQQVIKHARIVTQGQVVTDVELVGAENQGILKTIENGQVIIIRDGIRYNVMGTKIQ